MKTGWLRRAKIGGLAMLGAAGILAGQCPALPSLQALPAGDFITPAQEAEIGALTRRHQSGFLEEFQDPRLLAHAQAVLQRLEAALPATGYRFRLHLLDLPYSDAFAIPGGDIYLTRPMVNLLSNDDELAGVLAHEMGHVATHQLGLILSREFEAAGMRAAGSGEELEGQYNRVITWQERMQAEGKNRGRTNAEDNQVAADHVGMLLLIHAGFPPSAYVRAFDRIADLQGRTGGWLQTLLGTVSPDQNRLRAAEAEAKQLAALCPAAAPAAAGMGQGFAAWKAAVVAATNTWTARLPGLLTRQTLEPPLDENIQVLRFSPDGRHLLAQEGDDIWVLGRDPLRVELRITTPEALDPTFTPDSRSVVLHTPELRIERWDIASRARTWLAQLPEPTAFCGSTYLNPAGDRLACLRTNGSLILYNTLTGAIVARRDRVIKPVYFQLADVFMALEASWHPFFTASPSGRTLLVMTDLNEEIALDTETGAPIAVGGKATWRVIPGLGFLSETKVAVHRAKKKLWDIVEFPSGRVLRTVPLPATWVRPVTAGTEWVVGPVPGHAAAIFNPGERTKMTLGASTSALDGYDGVFAAQVGSGVALVKPGEKTPQILARLPLPSATLAALNAAAVSPDLTRLAISAGDRGGIWNLAAGRKEMTLRRFDGAWLNQGHAWMEFPAHQKTPPMLVTIDLSARMATGGPPQNKIARIVQSGPYLAVEAPYAAPRKGIQQSSAPWVLRTAGNPVIPSAAEVATWSWQSGREITLSDVTTGRAIWHETFDDDAPTVAIDRTLSALLLGWKASDVILESALGKEFDLSSRHVADRKDAVWIVALDPGSGKKIAALLLDPAPVVNLRVSAVIGHRLFIEDDIGRLLVYDLPSGKLAGVLDGVLAAASATGREVALLTGKHRALLVNADTLATTAELTFPAEAGLFRFSRDGSKLLAMTRDQTVYTFALAAMRQAGGGAPPASARAMRGRGR